MARRGGCCLTSLLRLALLVLLVPLALFLIPYLWASLGDSDAGPLPAPTVTSTERGGTGASTGVGSRSPGTSSGATTSGRTAGTTSATGATGGTSGPVRLDAKACPGGGNPYPGVAVGPGTSCAFAADTRLAYVNSGSLGKPVTLTVFSVARGANVTMACSGEALVTCASADGAKVYLYTGAVRLAE